jgi:hypothetical protein
MATYSSNKNCRSKSHSSTVGNWKYINYAKLINPKAPRVCCKVLVSQNVLITNVLCSGVNWTMFYAIMDVLMVSLRQDWRVQLILHNLTFNFHSLLGIVYVSFSMQFPTVEECDFDRQFLFDEYVSIFHRCDLKGVSLKSQITIVSSYAKIEFLATLMMHDSLLNFHSVFLRHPV